MKKILYGMVALLGLSLMPGMSFAEVPPDAWQAVGYASHNIAFASSSNVVGMTLYYTGTSTEATVQILNGGATFYAPNGTVDATGMAGSGQLPAGTFNFTTAKMLTVGQFCNAINASASYRCVLGATSNTGLSQTILRSTAPVGSNTSLNLGQNGGYQIFLGTQNVAGLAAGSVQVSSVVNSEAIGIWPSDPNHRVVLRKCWANTTDGTAGSLTVYGKLRLYEGVASGGVPNQLGVTSTGLKLGGGAGVQDDTVLVYREVAAAAATDYTADFTLGQAYGGLAFAKGAHVVVVAGGAGGFEGPSSYLECLWDEVQ